MRLWIDRFWPPLNIRTGGGGQPIDPMQRFASADTDTLLFAAHSFGQTQWGGVTSDGQHGGILHSDWPGATLSDFVGFGSARAVWNLNGHARNSSYDQIIVSEIADLSTGFPAPGPAIIETLQTFYWHGLEAAARGAELILFQPWSPVEPDLDASAAAAFAYCRQWLTGHLGVPVWIIPAGQYIRAVRSMAPDGVFSDGLHLRDRYPRGVSYLVYSFLTKVRCPFVRPDDEDTATVKGQHFTQARGDPAHAGNAHILSPLARASLSEDRKRNRSASSQFVGSALGVSPSRKVC